MHVGAFDVIDLRLGRCSEDDEEIVCVAAHVDLIGSGENIEKDMEVAFDAVGPGIAEIAVDLLEGVGYGVMVWGCGLIEKRLVAG